MDLMLVRKSHIALMSNTLKTLNNILADISQHDATTTRILNEDKPTFIPRDHEALVIENAYNNQNLQAVLAQLNASRATFVTFFESLTPEQWERAGIHPEYGDFPMTRSAMQVGTHDANHIEQITRILKEKR
jgi:hypothetical protein